MAAMTEMSPRFSRRSSRRSTFRTRPAAVAALAALTVAMAACGTSSGAATTKAAGPEKRDIVVAAVAGEGAGGLYIAQDKGLFAKAGLHVTIQTVTSSSTVIPAMLHGSVDVASGQYTSYFAVDAAGAAQLRILAAGYALGPHVQEIVVPGHSPITSPAGLKGKTIAVNAPNSETTDLLFTALAPYGITPAQVHTVVIPFPAMPVALAAGHVDAAFLIEPFITEAVKQHGVRELADIDTGASTSIPISGYAVLASWEKKYPRTAAAFAAAIKEGNRIAATNLTALQTAFQVQLHLSPQITGVMATGSFPTSASPVQLQRVADLMLRFGQLKQQFPAKSIISAG
jgi:NitT/TauT family transport system substrate-binding protein